MGGRVEGKTKKKSIKANVTSKFNSKRKLSRMGKKVKKGQMGPNTEFITRSAALRKLQITLKDFRRLCILKGIYPRVPSKGLKGNDKVYYDIKDISYIMHEPLLQKFRDFKAFMKKIRKAAGRNQHSEARRKDLRKPQIVLDHLVKERYPRFVDALRDLDDALCMVHLFAALPSSGRITAERTVTCNRLVRHWQYYISRSRSLHKVFVSVKGVYFQAQLMGEPITWLVPHQFTQYIPKEVDLRVMLTFLEFYEVFLQFVLFKLYSIRGWNYPPTVDERLDSAGCFLLAMKTTAAATTSTEEEAVQIKEINNQQQKKGSGTEHLATLPKLLAELEDRNDVVDDKEDDMDDDDEVGHLSDPLREVLNRYAESDDNGRTTDNNNADDDESIGELEQKTFDLSGDPRQRLFSKLVFFVNREVPLEWMQLCITALGGKIGWEGEEGSPYSVDDPRITHHIVDRPQLAVEASSSREYVQPQWVFDCINAQLLLPVQSYRPGAKLPPHLSPFVDDEKEGYVPGYSEQIKQLKEGKEKSEDLASSDGDNDDGDDNEDSEEEEQPPLKRKFGKTEKTSTPVEKVTKKSKSQRVHARGDDAEDASKVEEEQEIVKTAKGPKGVVHKPAATTRNEDEEAADLSKIMMTKKSKRLYGRMQHGIEKKQAAVKVLQEKRKQIDATENNEGKNSNAKRSKSKK